MKIKKFEQINEAYTVNNMRKILSEYHDLMSYMEPLILIKYDEIVELAKNDDDYEAESGDIPYKVNHERLYFNSIYNAGDNIEAELSLYDKYGSAEANFVIPITDEDIKNFEIGLDAKKYNI